MYSVEDFGLFPFYLPNTNAKLFRTLDSTYGDPDSDEDSDWKTKESLLALVRSRDRDREVIIID